MAKAKPVVVVVVSTQKNSGSSSFSFADELQRDRHFAHAHRMNPGATVRRESRSHLAIINAEALSKFVPVISAPQQLRDLSRKKKQQPERIEKIVEEPDHSACAHLGGNAGTLQETTLRWRRTLWPE